MSTETAIKIAREFGVPTAFLSALSVALWVTCSWTAENIVRPVVGSHTEFMKTEGEHMGKISSAIQDQTKYSEEIRNEQRRVRDVLAETMKEQKRAADEQKRAADALIQIRDDQRLFPAVAEKKNGR